MPAHTGTSAGYIWLGPHTRNGAPLQAYMGHRGGGGHTVHETGPYMNGMEDCPDGGQ